MRDRRGIHKVDDPVLVAKLLRGSYEMDLGEVKAFLPARVPLEELPPVFDRYQTACGELPARYPAGSGGVRIWLESEFRQEEPAVRDAIPCLTPAERDRLMTLLSVLGHTYRWDCVPPAAARFSERRIPLPPGIAQPWSALARASGQPRVGTTWSLHLSNWAMSNRPGGAAYRTDELTQQNVRIAYNWLPAPANTHLERFSTSFVLMEARGAAVLRHLVETVEAVAGCRMDDALLALEELQAAVKAMTVAFSLNVRKATVDPAVWVKLVQPTFPWSAEAEEPGRVEAGPSGMQMGSVQALDAALGVVGGSELAALSQAGRRYMPEPHRRFLQAVDRAGPVIRRFVQQSRCEDLVIQFNKCVGALGSFRAAHHARGRQYLRDYPDGVVARASTGLTIDTEDDAIATFERTMGERAAETEAAYLS